MQDNEKVTDTLVLPPKYESKYEWVDDSFSTIVNSNRKGNELVKFEDDELYSDDEEVKDYSHRIFMVNDGLEEELVTDIKIHPLNDAIQKSYLRFEVKGDIIRSFVFKDIYIGLQWHPQASLDTKTGQYYIDKYYKSCMLVSQKRGENLTKLVEDKKVNSLEIIKEKYKRHVLTNTHKKHLSDPDWVWLEVCKYNLKQSIPKLTRLFYKLKKEYHNERISGIKPREWFKVRSRLLLILKKGIATLKRIEN
jgi:hypothetical protein